MMTLTGIGLAVGASRVLVSVYGLLTLLIGVMFWVAGSRAAVAAALVVGFAMATAWIQRRRSLPGRTAIAGMVLAITILAMAMAWAYPDRGGASDALVGVRLRAEFAATSLRMWATEPMFGVGAGRYYGLSDRFMGPYLDHFLRENAHNNFLQIGAELGAVGFVGLVWLLVAAGRAIRRGLRIRAGARDPLLVGAGAGLAAYLVTCLAGHPLLTPATAYPFWIVSGLVVALGARLSATRTDLKRRRTATAMVVVGLSFLFATVPFRVDTDAGRDALFGLFGWEVEQATGQRFRWTGSHAAFFVPSNDQDEVRLPLRASQATRDRPVTVDVVVGGQRLARVPLWDRHWVYLPLRLPESRSWGGLHKVELVVDPPWPPEERRNGDGRTLGVMVGDLETAAYGRG